MKTTYQRHTEHGSMKIEQTNSNHRLTLMLFNSVGAPIQSSMYFDCYERAWAFGDEQLRNAMNKSASNKPEQLQFNF